MKSFREFQESVLLSEQPKPGIWKSIPVKTTTAQGAELEKLKNKAPGTHTSAERKKLLDAGLDDFVRGGRTQASGVDAVGLGLAAAGGLALGATGATAAVSGPVNAVLSPIRRVATSRPSKFIANNVLRGVAAKQSYDAAERGDYMGAGLNALAAWNPIGGGIAKTPTIGLGIGSALKGMSKFPVAPKVSRYVSQSAGLGDMIMNADWAKSGLSKAADLTGELRNTITNLGNNKTPSPPKLSSPNSATQQQVTKDNQKYGNTVPAGSFGISPKGTDRRKEVESQIKKDNAARAQNPTPTPTPTPNPDKRADSDNFDSGGNEIKIGDPVGGDTTPTPTPQPTPTPKPTETKKKPAVPRNPDGRIKLTPYKDRQYNPFQ